MNNAKQTTSIHLDSFIKLEGQKIDSNLIKEMNVIKEICSTVSFIRKENNIRVRIPLKKVIVNTKNPSIQSILQEIEAQEIIKDECNIINLELRTDDFDDLADTEINLNFKSCGKKFGNNLQTIMKNKDNFIKLDENKIKILDFVLEKEDYDFAFKPKNNNKLKLSAEADALISVDDAIDKDIFLLTLKRDIIRAIQVERKNKSLNINQKIQAKIQINLQNPSISLSHFVSEIEKETLCKSISFESKSDSIDLTGPENADYSAVINKIEIYAIICND
jgi:isoleucyl-tRNA synthetase